VEFLVQDIRQEQPAEPFDLILCRNLVFTYLDEAWQRQLLSRMRERVVTSGVLVLGRHEELPEQSGWTEHASALACIARSSELIRRSALRRDWARADVETCASQPSRPGRQPSRRLSFPSPSPGANPAEE
jgi:hypothetical protein